MIRLPAGMLRLAPGMIRLSAAACATVLFVLPLATMKARPVADVGVLGLLFAGVGIAGLWRWLVTAAGCVFLVDYAGALWLSGAPVGVGGAVAFGLSLLLLLHSVELGRCLRHAAVDARLVRSQIVGGVVLAAITLAAILPGTTLARGLVASIPFAAAPFVAAAAALGVVVAVATLATIGSRTPRRSP